MQTEAPAQPLKHDWKIEVFEEAQLIRIYNAKGRGFAETIRGLQNLIKSRTLDQYRESAPPPP